VTPEVLARRVRHDPLDGRAVTYYDVAGLTSAEAARLLDEVRAAYGLPPLGRRPSADFVPFAAAVVVVAVGVLLCLFN